MRELDTHHASRQQGKTMFGDYDNYRRRNGRWQPQPITEIPGPGRGRMVDPMTELGQQLRQARAEAAEWRETAEKWYATAQQQQADFKKLQKEMAAANRQLAELEKQLAAPPPLAGENDWQEKYLRLYAEFENNKKRLEQRYTLEAQQQQEKLLRDMLPLADNLERALTHAPDAEQQAGLEQIRKAFLSVLARYGVEPMAAEGRPFDPEQHEAIGAVPAANAEPGTIIAVEETGYTYQDKLLRPARVLVAK
jgi:molecular chaperone GrpE